jgi:pimeloyl-ACP methyl ester carboxylesterase
METFDRWAAEARRIEVGDLSLAVHDVGEGPVATFLHGYPSSSLDALPLIDRLTGVRVVAPDLPGFGASDKPVGHPYSIHGAVDAVEAIWDQLGVTSTVLVAHDYSVSVAQELLARQAESPDGRAATVTGVVWSNGGLYPDLHRPTYGQQLLLDPEHGAELAAAMTEDAFANGIRITWGERRPMGDEEVHDMWRALEHDGGARQMHALLHYVADRRANADRWRAALEANAVPMCFVWGELDPVSGGHVAERLAERLPSVPLVRLMDVGHWPPLEAPDELAAAVRELVG